MGTPNAGKCVTPEQFWQNNSLSPLDRLREADILAAVDSPLPFSLALPEDHGQLVSTRQAAVLVPFVRHDDHWAIVFIRRAQSRRDRHSGQVAFAGGMREAHDSSLRDTALREAHEEIGLRPGDVTPLGELPVHHSIAGIAITPVVATMPWPYPLQPAEAEVARIFTIPLAWLANKRNYEIVDITSMPSRYPGKSVSYREFDNERLWGATARITLTLVSQLSNHCGQPLPVCNEQLSGN